MNHFPLPAPVLAFVELNLERTRRLMRTTVSQDGERVEPCRFRGETPGRQGATEHHEALTGGHVAAGNGLLL